MGSSGGIHLYKLAYVTPDIMDGVADYLKEFVFKNGPNSNCKVVYVRTDERDTWGGPVYKTEFNTFEVFFQIAPGENFTIKNLIHLIGSTWVNVWLKKDYPFLSEDMLCVTYGDNVPEHIEEILDALEENLPYPDLNMETWT
jgi:hypothetical protein